MNQENLYSSRPNLFLKNQKLTQERRASNHTISILNSTPKLASLSSRHLFPSLKVWGTFKFKISHRATQHFHLPQINQGTIEGFQHASTTKCQSLCNHKEFHPLTPASSMTNMAPKSSVATIENTSTSHQSKISTSCTINITFNIPNIRRLPNNFGDFWVKSVFFIIKKMTLKMTIPRPLTYPGRL